MRWSRAARALGAAGCGVALILAGCAGIRMAVPDAVTRDMYVDLLKRERLDTLARFHVHPEIGVRFSPYAYVDPHRDQLFQPAELAALLSDTRSYTWGFYDGSGAPIRMPFRDYYDRFVYDRDYANAPQKSTDERLAGGNTRDNIADVYPGATVYEYYFPGDDPRYGGMDWRALRLVVQEIDGQRYLVGIIHDEWTT